MFQFVKNLFRHRVNEPTLWTTVELDSEGKACSTSPSFTVVKKERWWQRLERVRQPRIISRLQTTGLLLVVFAIVVLYCGHGLWSQVGSGVLVFLGLFMQGIRVPNVYPTKLFFVSRLDLIMPLVLASTSLLIQVLFKLFTGYLVECFLVLWLSFTLFPVIDRVAERIGWRIGNSTPN